MMSSLESTPIASEYAPVQYCSSVLCDSSNKIEKLDNERINFQCSKTPQGSLTHLNLCDENGKSNESYGGWQLMSSSEILCSAKESQNPSPAIFCALSALDEVTSTSATEETQMINTLNSVDTSTASNGSDNIEDENEQSNQQEPNLSEEEQSERLAWALQREEELQLVREQLQALREQHQAGLISAEDMRMLSAMVAGQLEEENGVEEEQHDESNSNNISAAEEQENEGEESEEWDYERLLQLGQTLGDVKTERWRLRAQTVINSLQEISYHDLCHDRQRLSGNGSTSCDDRCVICMDPYIPEDILRVLRCTHYLHSHCAAGWLADHSICPICKVKITASP